MSSIGTSILSNPLTCYGFFERGLEIAAQHLFPFFKKYRQEDTSLAKDRFPDFFQKFPELRRDILLVKTKGIKGSGMMPIGTNNSHQAMVLYNEELTQTPEVFGFLCKHMFSRIQAGDIVDNCIFASLATLTTTLAISQLKKLFPDWEIAITSVGTIAPFVAGKIIFQNCRTESDSAANLLAINEATNDELIGYASFMLRQRSTDINLFKAIRDECVRRGLTI